MDVLYHPNRWQRLNSDFMVPKEYERKLLEPRNPRNLPTVDGTYCEGTDYVDEIVAGFIRTYEFISDNPNVIREKYAEIRNLRTRIIATPSWGYMLLLRSVCTPDVLKNGAKVTVTFEKLLADRLTADGITGGQLSLYRRERASLNRLDIPRLTCDTSEYSLPSDDGTVKAIRQSGVDRLEERLDALSDEDCEKQVDCIKSSFDPDYAIALDTSRGTISGSKARHSARRREDEVPFSDAEIIANVDSMCDRIQRSKLVGVDGPKWVYLQPNANRSKVNFVETENGIYAGRAGIAVFFSIAARLLDRPEYRRAALEYVEPVRKTVREMCQGAENSANDVSLSAGIGSDIYSLTTIGDTLGMPELIADAQRVVNSLPPEIVDDSVVDVLSGSAGLLLALTKLYRQRPDESTLELARRCGKHVLDSRVETKKGCRVWPSSRGSQPLTGFSHGAAGVAYSLYRLYEITDEERFRRAGREAFEYVQSVFRPEEMNWPDFRVDEPVDATNYRTHSSATKSSVDAWCRGRSGIALSCVGRATIDDAPLALSGTLDVLDSVETSITNRTDTLCCSVSGRTDALLRASSAFDESRYYRTARDVMGGVCNRAAGRSCFALSLNTPRITNPTLFHGLAGVGYVLLRTLDPDRVPCLLLWE